MILALLLSSPSAHATELVWEGFYRGRALYLNSLSLTTSEQNELAEGASMYMDHRLSLRPAWLLSEHASLHAQIEAVPFTVFGSATANPVDAASGEQAADAFADGVEVTGPQVQFTRAWGEVNSRYGTFRMGRMPMEWGAGILWNPGNDVLSEYGDTADRLQYSNIFGPVWVMGAFDVQSEGLENDTDDMQAFSLAVGYKSEVAGAGLLNNYRYQGSLGWQAYTGSAWGYTQLGPITAELEVVARLGGGSLENGADITETSVGGVLDLAFQREKLTIGLQGGLATGDADPTDDKVKTFTFDPDHNVGLFLFEEPLPTLAAAVPTDANDGRDTTAVISGEGVSNALYLRPRVRYAILPELEGELSWLTATRAKADPDAASRPGLGNEIDVSLYYSPFPHVRAEGTFGVFLPGKYFTQYEHPDLGGGFDQPAIGGRLVGTVEF